MNFPNALLGRADFVTLVTRPVANSSYQKLGNNQFSRISITVRPDDATIDADSV